MQQGSFVHGVPGGPGGLGWLADSSWAVAGVLAVGEQPDWYTIH